MITPAQIRAARALLGWKQEDLATAAGISGVAIKNLERGASDPRSSTLRAIEAAFRHSGVEFIAPSAASFSGGEGVRRKGELGNE